MAHQRVEPPAASLALAGQAPTVTLGMNVVPAAAALALTASARDCARPLTALPGSVPFILAGLRLGVGHALIGVVVGELVAAQAGVGLMMAKAGATFQTSKVFAGLIIPTGPPDARFRIGISIAAQPELNVPRTPMSVLSEAYARAFDEHFAGSHAPVWAVESSQPW